MMKQLACYIPAFVTLVVCWTNVVTAPFLFLAVGHFLAMWLIAQGAK